MINDVINIKVRTENASEYNPTLKCYIPNMLKEKTDKNKRRAVIICPGGGYSFTSEFEAEPIALCYASKGIAAFVLYYSTEPARFPQAVCEAAEAMSVVRQNADKWHIDADKIAISGFSAGGHLAASLGVLYDNKAVLDVMGGDKELYKPNALILSYPVIIFGEKAHKKSFERLLGDRFSEQNASKLSLEKLVTKNTPPTFLWHTFADESVPVQNSLRFASALAEHNVSTEMHIFPHGNHGLSLSNEVIFNDTTTVPKEVEIWIDMAIRWFKNL